MIWNRCKNMNRTRAKIRKGKFEFLSMASGRDGYGKEREGVRWAVWGIGGRVSSGETRGLTITTACLPWQQNKYVTMTIDVRKQNKSGRDWKLHQTYLPTKKDCTLVGYKLHLRSDATTDSILEEKWLVVECDLSSFSRLSLKSR